MFLSLSCFVMFLLLLLYVLLLLCCSSFVFLFFLSILFSVCYVCIFDSCRLSSSLDIFVAIYFYVLPIVYFFCWDISFLVLGLLFLCFCFLSLFVFIIFYIGFILVCNYFHLFLVLNDLLILP
jgi:hypothetical protein